MKNEKNEWQTPPEIFELAQVLFGPFDLDAAADALRTLAERRAMGKVIVII